MYSPFFVGEKNSKPRHFLVKQLDPLISSSPPSFGSFKEVNRLVDCFIDEDIVVP